MSPNHCAILRFRPGDLLGIGGVDHVYVAATDGGHVLRRHAGSLEETFTHADMARAAGAADFVHGRGHFTPAGAFARQHSGVGRLADIPAAELPKVMWKLHWVEAFLEAEAEGGTTRSDASVEALVERLEAEARKLPFARADGRRGRKARAGSEATLRAAPGAKTLRTWVDVYEKGGCRAHALRSRHRFCGNREPRLAPEVYGLLNGAVAGYASEKRPTIVRIREDLELELDKLNAGRSEAGLEAIAPPSIKRVRKAVKALPAFTTYAARRGKPAARKRFLLVKGAIAVTRPGERVEMDEWLVHLQKLLVEAGLWLTLDERGRRDFAKRYHANIAVDAATRCVVGLSVGETATSALAIASLRTVVVDKSAMAAAAGCATPWDMTFTPDVIFTDGGPALTSDATRAAISDLCGGHDVPPAGEAERRPFVERFNRTLDLSFLPYFSGRTFTGVEDREDYDPQMRASLSLQAFCKALVRWIVDVYHNTPHEGLGGETPRHAWRRLTDLFGVVPPPAADARRAFLGVELRRRVSLRGVRLAGLHYGDAELGAAVLRRGLEAVTIRFDPHDLGAVSLRVGTAWRRLPCRTDGLDGTSWEEWTAAARDLRARFAAQAGVTRRVVLDAIRAIKAIAAQAEAEVGIDRLAPSVEDVERLEAGLLAGFEVPEAAERDPFDRTIATGGGAPPDDPPTFAASDVGPPEDPRDPRNGPRDAAPAAAPEDPSDETTAVPDDIEIED